MSERMTDEEKLAMLYDKADQLDREYEMAVSAYEIKGVWDFCRRCEENRNEIHQIETAQLRTDLAASNAIIKRLRYAAVKVSQEWDLDEIGQVDGDYIDILRKAAREEGEG